MNRKSKAVISNNSTKAQLVRLSSILFTILTGYTWLTITSAMPVSYGDFFARTIEGQLFTLLLIYIAGVAILSQCTALYFERRYEIKDKKHKGEWSWIMEDHVVFINHPNALVQVKREARLAS